MRLSRSLIAALAAFLVWFTPVAAEACAVCFGQTDSPLGRGQQWGVLVMLGFVFFMLSAIGGFAVFLARRARMIEAEAAETLAKEQIPT
jgi:hypothetical protein